jgi:transposase-like protein
MPVYQTLLSSAIIEARKENIGLDALAVQMFQSLMDVDRELFLGEQMQSGKENKGNGYYQRSLPSFLGKLTIAVPRDRQGKFTPLLLEIATNDASRTADLALQMYAKGLSTRDIEDIIRNIFGASMSASKVSEIAQRVEPLREAWQQRPITKEVIAIMADAIRMNVRIDNAVYNGACHIVIAIYADGTREVLGLWFFPEESSSAWSEVMQDLKTRGLSAVPLVISDELTGIVNAMRDSLSCQHQLCLVHRKRTLITHVRSDRKAEFSTDFNAVFDIDAANNSLELIEGRLEAFHQKWEKSVPNIRTKLAREKLSNYAAFLHFPVALRRMIYTTNMIERLNAQIRKVTKRTPAFPSEKSMLNLVYLAVQEFETGPYRYPLHLFKSEMQSYILSSKVKPNSDTIC